MLAPGGLPVQVDFTGSQASFQWYPLPANRQYTPARGQFVALVLQQIQSDGVGSTVNLSQEGFAKSGFPQSNVFNGLNWQTTFTDRYPVAGLRFEGTEQPAAQGHPAVGPTVTTLPMETAAVGERLAMRFKFTSAAPGASFKVAGLRVQASACAASNLGQFRVGL